MYFIATCIILCTRTRLVPRSKVSGGASNFAVNRPPDTLLRSKLSAPGTLLRSKVTFLEVNCLPCEGTVCFEEKCPGENLLRSSIRGTTYFEVECPGDNLLRSRVSGGTTYFEAECPGGQLTTASISNM